MIYRFYDEDDTNSKNDQRDCGPGVETGQNNKVPDSEAVASLSEACPYLRKLELIDSHTRVSLFSTDSPMHSARHPCTKYRDQLTDSSLPALASLSFLTHLTLAGLQNVRHGRGLVDITRGCGQLSYLSLAYLGLQADCTFLPALCEALKHATNLADFRLEHRYMSISSRLIQSLASCTKLRRLCLITETGCVERSASFGVLIESCAQLTLLLVITNDSETARRSMRRETKNKKKTRAQLSVVFGSTEDVRNQRGRHDTLKFVSHQDLRELVLFDSHVCQPELHMDIT
ncbi:F-box/LRR-repeat protein 18-like [Diadema setosum]|uniref:F-box/LRR-repeat protein 18-like n=1 Tax=Diadema setosum TaxID=31175 RepID=UPI003B3A6481